MQALDVRNTCSNLGFPIDDVMTKRMTREAEYLKISAQNFISKVRLV